MSIRIDRLLAARGAGTRSEVRRLIRRGHVTVDGALERDPARHVPADCVLAVDGEPAVAPPTVLVFHKPAGVVSTVRDPWGRASLATALPAGTLDRLHPVGRLDAETTGLLLLCAEGRLTQRLLHPRRAVERAYDATVEGAPGPELVGALAAGVETADGRASARVDDIAGDRVHLVVTEGRHRMVRRMLANAGFPVLALRRVRFGEIRLGDLPAGELRALTPEESAWLVGLASYAGSSGSLP